MRVTVHGPAECEEGSSWAVGVFQGGEEMTMMCVYDQKIGEEELQGVGVDDLALCFVDDFDCDTTT